MWHYQEIELHDSTLDAIAQIGHTTRLVFESLPVYGSNEPFFIGSVWSWVQSGLLCITHATRTDQPQLPWDIMSGEIIVRDRQYRNIIPVPLNVRGTTRFTCINQFGERLDLSGDSITLTLFGTPTNLTRTKI